MHRLQSTKQQCSGLRFHSFQTPISNKLDKKKLVENLLQVCFFYTIFNSLPITRACGASSLRPSLEFKQCWGRFCTQGCFPAHTSTDAPPAVHADAWWAWDQECLGSQTSGEKCCSKGKKRPTFELDPPVLSDNLFVPTTGSQNRKDTIKLTSVGCLQYQSHLTAIWLPGAKKSHDVNNGNNNNKHNKSKCSDDSHSSAKLKKIVLVS